MVLSVYGTQLLIGTFFHLSKLLHNSCELNLSDKKKIKVTKMKLSKLQVIKVISSTDSMAGRLLVLYVHF